MDKLEQAARQVDKTALRVEQDCEEALGEDGMVMVVPLDVYNDMMEAITALREALAEQAEQEPVGENKAVRCFLMLYGANRGLTVGDMRRHMQWCGYGEWPEMIRFEPETNHLTKAVAQFWIRFLFKRYDTRTAPHTVKEVEPRESQPHRYAGSFGD